MILTYASRAAHPTVIAMQFREVRLQDLWQATHPGKPIPAEVGRLRSWECVLDLSQVGHCTGHAGSGEIIGLAVAPAHRGLGIGRKLLSLVVEDLRACGVERIWAAAPADPASRAYGFYRALGWVPTGERPPDESSEILELRAG
jgi:ribosomal protein S18 acetylase RimI-like enzyme